jgi:tetratricopeptide (TPR) repeat protein
VTGRRSWRATLVVVGALLAACAAPPPPPRPPSLPAPPLVSAFSPLRTLPRAPSLPAFPPPAPPVTRAPEPDDGEGKFHEADTLARTGGYPTAARILEELARQPPTPTARARALYALGHLFVLADNPGRDYRQALLYFERLVREHPESAYVADARAWRELISAYFARIQELERLKRLDVELERERPRP